MRSAFSGPQQPLAQVLHADLVGRSDLVLGHQHARKVAEDLARQVEILERALVAVDEHRVGDQVLVDGKAIVSCQQPLSKVAGNSVVTLEGVDTDERDRYADAFAACGGLQCGFCLPGIVMRAKAQIDKKGADLMVAALEQQAGADLGQHVALDQSARLRDVADAHVAGEPPHQHGRGEHHPRAMRGDFPFVAIGLVRLHLVPTVEWRASAPRPRDSQGWLRL